MRFYGDLVIEDNIYIGEYCIIDFHMKAIAAGPEKPYRKFFQSAI